ESAITDAPQTPQKMANTGAGATNASGDSRQHNPLIESATTAAFFRPYLSAARPPARQPAYPTTPSVKKIIAWPYPRKSGEAGEFRTNNGIQVQRAYTSHMSPKYPRLTRRGPASSNIASRSRGLSDRE